MIQITGESQDHTFLIGVRYLGQTAIVLLFMRNKLFKETPTLPTPRLLRTGFFFFLKRNYIRFIGLCEQDFLVFICALVITSTTIVVR